MKTSFIKFVASIALMTAFLTSCTKLIEIPPNPAERVPGEILFADSIGVMSAWAGIYDGFSPSQLSFYSGTVTITTGLASDELVTSPTGLASDVSFQNNNILTTDGKMATIWREAYVNLFKINSCLENINATNAVTQATKNQLIGEAKFARAYTYFHLVNLVGGVPLVTTTDYKVNKQLPRNSVDEVYSQIMADLTEAKLLLGSNYPSAGRARPNVMVANALLARVYLYRGLWREAELAANDVISSGTYQLAPLASIFLKDSPEAIWQLPSNGTNSQTAEGFNFVPVLTNSRVPVYFLTASMLDSVFKAGDLRRAQWTGVKTLTGTSYYFPAKYKQRAVAITPLEDYVLFRLSEMYLIRAEAYARQEKTTEAIADLNTIRNTTRVNVPAYAGPANSTAIIAEILRERRTELFCEGGHRWYDLKRTGKVDQVLGSKKPTYQSTDALFPIPQEQITNNPFLKQNLGYL